MTTFDCRAVLAQPEPVGATDDELIEIAHELRKTAEYLQLGCGWGRALKAIESAANLIESDLFQRLAPPHHALPVPVSERLPGPEDCDPDGECWLWEPDINGHAGLGHWQRQHREWASDVDGDATHWLPHWALPVPVSERLPGAADV